MVYGGGEVKLCVCVCVWWGGKGACEGGADCHMVPGAESPNCEGP